MKLKWVKLLIGTDTKKAGLSYQKWKSVQLKGIRKMESEILF